MKKEEFDLYSHYKKNWILPLILTIVVVVSIISCFVFRDKCKIGYDISLSVFTGSILFVFTQLILYINKIPKIRMQHDKEMLFTIKYKLTQIQNRLIALQSIDKEEDFIELKKLLTESYKLIHQRKKDIVRVANILAKRIDCVFWAYLFFISKKLEQVSHNEVLENSNDCIKVGSLTMKYFEILNYLKEKIDTFNKQISELYNDYKLFYENEKQKIIDEIF